MVSNLLRSFLSESFVPHGHCYLWQPGLVWTNVISDALIALAYYFIPLVLVYVVRKRGDLPFDWVFFLFGGFIIACGTGHVLEIWTLWHPMYWLSSAIKVFTAGVSISTAVVLTALIPQILRLPSPAQLTEANLKLEQQIIERQETEKELERAHQRLKFHVENSPLAVVELDQNFRIRYWSKRAEELFGWTESEVLGRAHCDRWLIHEEDLAGAGSTLALLAEGKLPRFVSEVRNHTQSGEIVHCQWYSSVLFDPQDHPDSMLCLGLDVTERTLAEVALQQSEVQLRLQTQQLEETLLTLRKTQSQLIHTEKMSSLGQLVAGVAHEINNPVSFIYGNLEYAETYIHDLLALVALYDAHFPKSSAEIRDFAAEIDLDFLSGDLPKMLSSMKIGADRIRQIVLSLRNFSRLDQAAMKSVDIHEGLDSTLLILQHRLKANASSPGVQVVKEYGDLNLVECYAGQLNQVFMNVLSNAIDALEESAINCSLSFANDPTLTHDPKFRNHPRPTILIRTERVDLNQVKIVIADNGLGIPPDIRDRLFDPFFTTKPMGKGTGLGLAISYEVIVRQHGGRLDCCSEPGKTEFQITIPVQQHSAPIPVSGKRENQ